MKGFLFNFEKEAAMKNITHKAKNAVRTPGSLLADLLAFRQPVLRILPVGRASRSPQARRMRYK
jgi:hypothetical protein